MGRQGPVLGGFGALSKMVTDERKQHAVQPGTEVFSTGRWGTDSVRAQFPADFASAMNRRTTARNSMGSRQRLNRTHLAAALEAAVASPANPVSNRSAIGMKYAKDQIRATRCAASADHIQTRIAG